MSSLRSNREELVMLTLVSFVFVYSYCEYLQYIANRGRLGCYFRFFGVLMSRSKFSDWPPLLAITLKSTACLRFLKSFGNSIEYGSFSLISSKKSDNYLIDSF